MSSAFLTAHHSSGVALYSLETVGVDGLYVQRGLSAIRGLFTDIFTPTALSRAPLPREYQILTPTMRWPPWSSTSSTGRDERPQPVSWIESLNAIDWAHYTDPRTVIPTVLLTGTVLLSTRFYRLYLRRIPQAVHIQPAFWRRRSLLGRVTSVGDGDNFRLFHTPGGRLAGWGWMPGRKVPRKTKDLKDKTVCRTRA